MKNIFNEKTSTTLNARQGFSSGVISASSFCSLKLTKEKIAMERIKNAIIHPSFV